MQHQTTYYRTVPVSEKPKKSGYYLTPLGKVYYSSRKKAFTVRNPTHYLQPISLPDAEAQAEWEFVKIMQENYNAAKRGEESAFSGKTKKEAVLEVYEDLLEIIKGLPLKRTGSVEGFLKSIDALKEPDAERLRDALDKIVNHPEGPEQAFPKLTVDMFKHIAREALSQTGDGWVRVGDGLPEDRERWCWVVWKKDNSIDSANGLHVRLFKDDYSHWRYKEKQPLPPQPINK